MLLYTCIMVTVGAGFVWLGMAIGKGRVDLIHDYHQKNVASEARAAYGKAMGSGLLIMAAAMLASGAAAPVLGGGLAVGLLLGGFAIGIAALIRAQKRFNGGIF